MPGPRDRTSEFRQCHDSIRSRSASKPTPARKPKQQQASASKSEIARLAGGIARDINATTGKLQKLAQLAKRKTLFDDRPVEISELTYIIKQDISDLNSQIASLQQLTKGAGGPQGKKSGSQQARQVEEHNSNVVMLLQSKLANMGMGFKDVLEIRTQNMKASKDRTEQFMHTTSAAPAYLPSRSLQPPSSTLLAPGHVLTRRLTPPPRHASPTESILAQPPPSRTLYGGDSSVGGSTVGSTSDLNGNNGYPVDRKGKARGGDYLALDMESAETGPNGAGGHRNADGFMQMELMEQQDDYIQTRSTAIETIESTIAELGTIFQQLASMVAEQRETVQRIDADVHDISNNVSGAQRELLKYYASVSSNRMLMVKIFGVLIIFFLLFILVT